MNSSRAGNQPGAGAGRPLSSTRTRRDAILQVISVPQLFNGERPTMPHAIMPYILAGRQKGEAEQQIALDI